MPSIVENVRRDTRINGHDYIVGNISYDLTSKDLAICVRCEKEGSGIHYLTYNFEVSKQGNGCPNGLVEYIAGANFEQESVILALLASISELIGVKLIKPSNLSFP